MLAGFEEPTSGRIILDDEDITALPPHRRPVNMMFQSYALFPHMNVVENVMYGLRMSGVAKDAARSRAVEALRAARLRPEVRLTEVPAPQRIAPYAVAMTADVLTSVDDDDELATGRFVLLFDPSAPEPWSGQWRVVTFARLGRVSMSASAAMWSCPGRQRSDLRTLAALRSALFLWPQPTQ